MSKKQRNSDVPQNSAHKYPRKAISLKVSKDEEEASRSYAKLIISPELAAYRLIKASETAQLIEDLDVPSMLEVLRGQAKEVNQNDLSQAEAMLTNQAVALQSLFVHLSEKAFKQEFLNNFEMMMKLAFKAQSQCRATIETLSAIKNPPVVIAKQANIANGPQQVNNGAITNLPARENSNLSNELLKDSNETVDSGRTITASPTDQKLATME